MAQHDQQPSASLRTCVSCKDGQCYACVDVLRSAYSDENICLCRRHDHATDRDTAILSKQLANIQWGGDQSPC